MSVWRLIITLSAIAFAVSCARFHKEQDALAQAGIGEVLRFARRMPLDPAVSVHSQVIQKLASADVVVRDPWGTLLDIGEAPTCRGLAVSSAGRDEVFSTADDLTKVECF